MRRLAIILILMTVPAHAQVLGYEDVFENPTLTGDWNGARTRLEDRGVGFAFDYTPARYALLSCVTQAKYLALSFWPFPLIFDRGPDGPAPGGWIALAGIVFALGAIAATLVLLRRAPRWAFVCCWFFVILLPTTSVIPVAGQPVGENRVYLSLAAAMVTLVLAVDHFARRASLSLLVGGIVALATLTIARNRVYATELSLWQDTLRKVPGNSRAHQYYGSALARANRMDEALREFEVSLSIRPTHFTYGKLGFALFEKGRLDEARQALEIAVKLAPDYPGHRANLGGVYFQLGRWPDALAQLQRAVELAPRHVHARTNLGVILGRMGRYREAIAEFERVQALDPTNAEALRSLPQLRALAASASAPPR